MLFGSHAGYLLNFRGPLIRELIQRGHTVVAAAPDHDYTVEQELARIGAKYHPLPVARSGTNPLSDIATLINVDRALELHRPDLLLAYTMKPVIYGALAAARRGIRSASIITGLGVVFSDHRLALKQRLLRTIVETMLRASLPWNERVFFQNPDDQDLFIRLRLATSAQARLVNGSGVDLQHFAASPPPTGPLTFLLMTRLLREKGVLEYAAAARALRAKYAHVRFRLLGPSDPGPGGILPDDIRAIGGEALEYLGEVRDVRPHLRAASVVVLPSYYREGIPRSLLEALAVGRAIVTTDMPGCRETVRSGHNGFLIETRNADALRIAMERFITEPWLVGEFGSHSRAMAESRFDVNAVNAELLAHLKL